MAGKISELTAAVSVADVDQFEVLQGSANKRATAAMIRAGLQPVDATLTALAALGAGPGFLQVTGQDTFSIAALSGAQVNTALGYTAANAASLASSALSGALPALDGSALTALNASNLTSGTVPTARLATGTADGTTFLRGDGVWAAAGGGGYDKLVESGGNGGTLTLNDDTAGSGVSQFAVTDGDGQGTTPQVAFGPPAASGLGVSFYARPSTAYLEIMTRDRSGFINVAAASYSTFNTNFDNSGILMGLAGALAWTSGAAYWQGSTDTGLTRAPIGGVVRATNGSSGSGGFEGVSLQGASSTALAAATPTAFVDIPVASGARIGGIIEYCVEADDGTDFQIESGVIQFAAVNKAGTVTTATPTATGTPLQVLNSGTLTAAFTATAGADKVTINCDAASSLPETTLRIRFRVHVNSSTTAIAVAPL